MCCTAPLMPNARYSCGSTTTPVVPIWRSWRDPAAVGDDPRGARRWRRALAPRAASCSKRSGPSSPAPPPTMRGASARSIVAGSGGRISSTSASRRCRRRRASRRRRRPSAARRRRRRPRRARPAAAWRRTRGPAMHVGAARVPPLRVRSTPSAVMRVAPANSGRCSSGGEAGCEVAPVGRAGQDHDPARRRSSGASAAAHAAGRKSPSSTCARRWRCR